MRGGHLKNTRTEFRESVPVLGASAKSRPRRLKRIGRKLLCSAAVLALPAHAGNWFIEPGIRVQETYSNNSTGTDEGGFITEINPYVSLTGRSARLDVDYDYSPSVVLYSADSSENRIEHNLSSRGTFEAIENFFYLESRASISQQLLSPAGSQSRSAADNDNRYSASRYSVAPYFKGFIGRNDYLLRHETSWVDSNQVDADQVDDISGTTQRITGRFNTPVPLFGFSAEYDDRNSDYDSGREIEMRTIRGILHYRLDQELMLSARVGSERNNFDGDEKSGGIYGIGVQWNPGPRTNLNGFYEHHYYGGSYLVNFRHRMSRTVFGINASRGISTFDDSLDNSGFTYADALGMYFRALNPNATDAQVRNFINLALQGTGIKPGDLTPGSLFTEQAQLLERIEATMVMYGARNELTFRIFATESESISSGDSTLLPNLPGSGSDFLIVDKVKSQGVQVSLNHRLTALTNLIATLTHTKSKTEGATADDSVSSTQNTLVVRATHKLGPKTSSFTGLRFSKGENDDSDTDSDETAIFAGLDHRF